MSRDSLVKKYNERHDGVDYFYTTCHNNGCWDATCLIKCGIKDGKVVSIEPDDSVNAGIAREDDDENAVRPVCCRPVHARWAMRGAKSSTPRTACSTP